MSHIAATLTARLTVAASHGTRLSGIFRSMLFQTGKTMRSSSCRLPLISPDGCMPHSTVKSCSICLMPISMREGDRGNRLTLLRRGWLVHVPHPGVVGLQRTTSICSEGSNNSLRPINLFTAADGCHYVSPTAVVVGRWMAGIEVGRNRVVTVDRYSRLEPVEPQVSVSLR